MTITLNHFSAAAVFALFASIVFGITHREDTRDMVRYGLYCFAMFLGGVLVAGWSMWVLRRLRADSVSYQLSSINYQLKTLLLADG